MSAFRHLEKLYDTNWGSLPESRLVYWDATLKALRPLEPSRLTVGASNVTIGNFTIGAGGTPISLLKMGEAVLVAGTVTVNDAAVLTASKIFLTVKTTGGTRGNLTYTISTGVSFTITSSSGTETSTVEWLMLNP